jgi:D-arginine dehydrogenase
LPETQRFDIAVVGAGIAGASAAAELAGAHRVVLLEREFQPGYHTTGRSAALFSQTYGPPAIRALTRASARFFENPPEDFAAAPLLSPRGMLMIARSDQREHLEAAHRELSADGAVSILDEAEITRLAPLVRRGYAAAALYENTARDIDVHALHHGFLKRFRAAGGIIKTDCEVRTLEREGARWRIETPGRTFVADVVVNAAGAWADEIAKLAGVPTIGLVPKRRTALIVAAPAGIEIGAWPMVVDVQEQFYMKPDAGRLLVSPADETPSPPCDAQPEELDIAICVDRIQTAFEIEIKHIGNKWAGLRSFVADKVPVAGYDPAVPDFFWLAGQGGYGIQSAPALARTAAALVRGQPLPGDVADQGLEASALAVERLSKAA